MSPYCLYYLRGPIERGPTREEQVCGRDKKYKCQKITKNKIFSNIPTSLKKYFFLINKCTYPASRTGPVCLF